MTAAWIFCFFLPSADERKECPNCSELASGSGSQYALMTEHSHVLDMPWGSSKRKYLDHKLEPPKLENETSKKLADKANKAKGKIKSKAKK